MTGGKIGTLKECHSLKPCGERLKRGYLGTTHQAEPITKARLAFQHTAIAPWFL